MYLLPPRPQRTDTLFPYTTRFRSGLGQCVDRRGLGQRRRLDRLGLRQRRHGGLGEGGRGHRKGGEAGKTVGTGVAHELGSGIPLVTRGRPRAGPGRRGGAGARSEEHTSELQSLMRISYAVFCLKKKKKQT